MNAQDLLGMADDPRFIPRIHDYCDSWCERCAFTDRCLSYSRQQAWADSRGGDPGDFDDAFDLVIDVLQQSLNLLQEMAEEEGIDPDAIDASAQMAEKDRILDEVENHPMSRATMTYVGLANDWLGMIAGSADAAGGDFDILAGLRTVAPAWDGPIEDLIEAVEVVQRLEMVIVDKVQMALLGRRQEVYYDRSADEMPTNADGVAKMGLLAIDRSISAWATLLPVFPARQAATLEIMALLSRLRVELEQEFPDAWAFVRPGFDE